MQSRSCLRDVVHSGCAPQPLGNSAGSWPEKQFKNLHFAEENDRTHCCKITSGKQNFLQIVVTPLSTECSISPAKELNPGHYTLKEIVLSVRHYIGRVANGHGRMTRGFCAAANLRSAIDRLFSHFPKVHD